MFWPISPEDRVDALVWALTDLLVEPMPSEALEQLWYSTGCFLRARQTSSETCALLRRPQCSDPAVTNIGGSDEISIWTQTPPPDYQHRPSVTGMLSWVWVNALLMWAGMSSGPSSLWRYGATFSGTMRRKASRSRVTSGDAFSWISSGAEVCGM
jgi:hypothetical protein